MRTERETPEAKATVEYETREAIMGCGCRIIMDAATYDAEGATCQVHQNSEVVRVIKVPPVLVEAPPPPETRGKDDDDDRKPRRRGR